MTIIKLYRDDSGVQQLQKQNAADPVTEDVNSIQPYPKINPMAPKRHEEDLLPVFPKHSTKAKQHKHRGPDRRRQQRRQRDQDVLLDTRSQHERRSRLRRSNDPIPGRKGRLKQQQDRPPGIGVDRFV